MKQRVDFIDLAKGICIILIVLNHTFGRTVGSSLESIMVFRMPLYIVLSGLFFKSYGGFPFFFKKKVNKLLIPMLLAFLMISIPSTLLLNLKAEVPTTMYNLVLLPAEPHKLNFGLSPSSWFLLCLFIINILFYFIYLICKEHIISIMFLSTIFGAVGYFCSVNSIILPLWMDTSLTAMPFFCMGYILRNYTEILYESFSTKYFFVLICSVVFLLFSISYIEEGGDILYVGNHYDINPFCLYLGGISGTLCVLIISKYMNCLPLLSYFGRYSIVILLTHQLYLFIIRNILYQIHAPQDSIWVSIGVFILVVLLSLPTIKYGIKYLPYCFAQKEILK